MYSVCVCVLVSEGECSRAVGLQQKRWCGPRSTACNHGNCKHKETHRRDETTAQQHERPSYQSCSSSCGHTGLSKGMTDFCDTSRGIAFLRS